MSRAAVPTEPTTVTFLPADVLVCVAFGGQVYLFDGRPGPLDIPARDKAVALALLNAAMTDIRNDQGAMR